MYYKGITSASIHTTIAYKEVPTQGHPGGTSDTKARDVAKRQRTPWLPDVAARSTGGTLVDELVRTR